MPTQRHCADTSARRRKQAGDGQIDADQELERRRLQNRIAQRKYRDNVQQRLQEYNQLKAVLSVVDPTALPNGISESDHDIYSKPRRKDQELASRTACLHHQPSIVHSGLEAQGLTSSGLQAAPLMDSASVMADQIETFTTEDQLQQTEPARRMSETSVPGFLMLADTPLHLAAASSHVEVVQLLLEKGAVIDMPNGKQETALHVAASRGHIGVVDCLLKAGARINLKDCTGMMPLHRAVANGHADLARRLVMVGADVNAKWGGT